MKVIVGQNTYEADKASLEYTCVFHSHLGISIHPAY